MGINLLYPFQKSWKKKFYIIIRQKDLKLCSRYTKKLDISSFFVCPDPHEFLLRPNMGMLILDATYIHRNSLCALVAINEHNQIFWHFARYESSYNWATFLSCFGEPQVLVMDGQKGLFAAARLTWPQVHIQRCQFHVISFALQYLGRHPKEEVGKALLHLLYTLKDAKTQEGRDRWLQAYWQWESYYGQLFSERTKLGVFQYPRLRSVRFIIRKALPNLFTFLDYPGTPNTTNLVEGWVNSAVAEALRLHRGLHEYEKKALVSVVLSHLRRGRTAQDLSKERAAKAARKKYYFRNRRAKDRMKSF